MPLYEYECPKCGRFDALQKMSDAPLATHDVCGSAVRKLISASAFAFKGSGFYITDYGGKSTACVNATPERARSEKKSEAKPAACASCPANRAA